MNVEYGDLIEVSPHIFLCGDVMEGDILALLAYVDIDEKIDMIYSDPPWSSANCRYWRTIAKKTCESIETWPVSFDIFLSHITHPISCIAKRINVMWIEASMKEYNKVVEAFNSYDTIREYLPFSGEWTICYGSPKRPNKLLRFSQTNTIKDDPTYLSSEAPTDWAFKQDDSQLSETVFDFCIGQGMTARKAYKYNKTVYGLELNPKRLKKTIEFFENKGFKARKIS
jgi:hypothetical protein